MVVAPLGAPALSLEVRIITGDSTGVIDSGEGIDPTSLGLEANTLSWIHTGVRRTAPLE